jgi:hypothetical protein
MFSKKILVIGDSHSCFWYGKNELKQGFYRSSTFSGIDIFHLGPVTANGISRTQPFHEKFIELESFLIQNNQSYGCLIFSFGEIDCRCHIVRLAVKNNQSINELANQTAEKYFSFVNKLTTKYNICSLIWGPVPSNNNSFDFNTQYPSAGTSIERNYATHIFSERLNILASFTKSIAHIDIFNYLTDEFYMPRKEYFWDGCHISQKFNKKALQMLRYALCDLKAEDLISCLTPAWPISKECKMRNISAGKEYIVSSKYGNLSSHPFTEEPNGSYSFHTDLEEQPYIVIDLGGSHELNNIVIHNRQDGAQERAKSLAVSVSIDGTNYFSVYCPPETDWYTFGSKDKALSINVRHDGPICFIKLFLRTPNYFHLECVQVFGKSFLS